MPSSMMVSMVAITAAEASGLPPNVEACVPGSKASITRSLATIAPTGKPLPRRLREAHDVGLYAVVLVAEELACPADARLHFVEDSRMSRSGRKLSQFLHVLP